VGGAGFMTTEDMMNGWLFPKGVVEADIVNAGNPEHMGHPFAFQGPDKMFRKPGHGWWLNGLAT